MRFEMDAYFKAPLPIAIGMRGGALDCVVAGVCSQTGKRTNTPLHPSHPDSYREGNRTGYVKKTHISHLISHISQTKSQQC
jgi:hypothetical protein